MLLPQAQGPDSSASWARVKQVPIPMPPVDGAHALKRKLVWGGGGGAADCITPPPFILAQVGSVTGRAREGSSVLGSCGFILAMGSMESDHVGTVGVLCTGKSPRFC